MLQPSSSSSLFERPFMMDEDDDSFNRRYQQQQLSRQQQSSSSQQRPYRDDPRLQEQEYDDDDDTMAGRKPESSLATTAANAMTSSSFSRTPANTRPPQRPRSAPLRRRENDAFASPVYHHNNNNGGEGGNGNFNNNSSSGGNRHNLWHRYYHNNGNHHPSVGELPFQSYRRHKKFEKDQWLRYTMRGVLLSPVIVLVVWTAVNIAFHQRQQMNNGPAQSTISSPSSSSSSIVQNNRMTSNSSGGRSGVVPGRRKQQNQSTQQQSNPAMGISIHQQEQQQHHYPQWPPQSHHNHQQPRRRPKKKTTSGESFLKKAEHGILEGIEVIGTALGNEQPMITASGGIGDGPMQQQPRYYNPVVGGSGGGGEQRLPVIEPLGISDGSRNNDLVFLQQQDQQQQAGVAWSDVQNSNMLVQDNSASAVNGVVVQQQPQSGALVGYQQLQQSSQQKQQQVGGSSGTIVLPSTLLEDQPETVMQDQQYGEKSSVIVIPSTLMQNQPILPAAAHQPAAATSTTTSSSSSSEQNHIPQIFQSPPSAGQQNQPVLVQPSFASPIQQQELVRTNVDGTYQTVVQSQSQDQQLQQQQQLALGPLGSPSSHLRGGRGALSGDGRGSTPQVVYYYYDPDSTAKDHSGNLYLPPFVYDSVGRPVPIESISDRRDAAIVYHEPSMGVFHHDNFTSNPNITRINITFEHPNTVHTPVHDHKREGTWLSDRIAKITDEASHLTSPPMSGSSSANPTDQSILVGTVGVMALLVGALSARRMRRSRGGSVLSLCVENEALEDDDDFDEIDHDDVTYDPTYMNNHRRTMIPGITPTANNHSNNGGRSAIHRIINGTQQQYSTFTQQQPQWKGDLEKFDV